MLVIDRREFLRGTAATGLTLAPPTDLFAQAAAAAPASAWDAGALRHLLPTVSDSRILIKASFNAPLADAPTLRIGGTSVHGRMGDTRGEHWHFYATDLKPGRPLRLSLAGPKGRALCQPWELATFPGPDERPEKFRLLIYTCAGGHEVHKFLATATRNRLLRRALRLAPDAVIANGDHVYWYLLAPLNARLLGASLKRSSLPVRSIVRRRAGSDREACSKAPPARRSSVYEPTSGWRRSFSCRTITIISTMTRRPTRRSASAVAPMLQLARDTEYLLPNSFRCGAPAGLPTHRPAIASGASRKFRHCGSATEICTRRAAQTLAQRGHST